MSDDEKTVIHQRHEQLIYWASIAVDVLVPRQLPGIYVLGYVKSGINWLCHLLSSALELPILEPWKRNLPAVQPCIYHMHRFIPLDSVRWRTIYMMRDGRDTMVSKYFHIAREGGLLKKRLETYLGRPVRYEDTRINLPEFIRFLQGNRIASVDYKTHIEGWKRHCDKYVPLRYEDLLADTESELARVISAVAKHEADAEHIRAAVERHDFTHLTARSRGEEDRASFIRKGIAGDWRNHFTAESGRVFDEYAGDLLFELGYESDPRWWEALEHS